MRGKAIRRREKCILVILLFVGCLGFSAQAELAKDSFPAKSIATANNHAVAIAVYYTMGEQEYQKRLSKNQNIKKRGLYYLYSVQDASKPNQPEKCIAYIGAGGIVKNNYIITVKHLFDFSENTTSMTIWVFQQYWKVAYEAEVVAISPGLEFADDYAVIKLKKPENGELPNLPGLKISNRPATVGEEIIFIGSTGGMAFHTRFGIATKAEKYLEADENGVLHLKRWENFPLLMTYPGGPGDSGGIVLNKKGELIGIMYCGIEVYAEHYIFANPLEFLWEFLSKNNLEWLR